MTDMMAETHMSSKRMATPLEKEKDGEAVPIIGIDDGFAQTKVYGRLDGAPLRLIIPSSVRPGVFGLSALHGDSREAAYRTEEGEEFTVAAHIATEPTTFPSFHFSGMNRVLVAHALVMAGLGGRSVDIMVGLPIGEFFENGVKSEARIARKVANIQRGVVSLAGAPLARPRRVRVGCQAIAAFVDWLLGEDAMPRRSVPERAAVVDIGGCTTDIAVIVQGDRIDHSRTGTARIGVLALYEMIAAGLRTRFAVQDVFPLEVLARAVRERTVRLWGKDERIDNLVDYAIAQFRGRVVREIERKLGGGSDLDIILFVGGGANLIGDIREYMPNAVQVEDPELANARGLWKYACCFNETAI